MSQNSETSSSPRDELLTQKRLLNVTEDEKGPSKYKRFNDIDDIFSHYTSLSEFCIGGQIELNEKTSKFFYESSNGAIQCIDVLNISEEEVHSLANNCSVSPFGMGSKSVVDPNVRLAKELGAKDFAFQFNPRMKSSIRSQIKKLLGGREFLIEPYKLNIYPEGGHFKRHKDTLKNDKMIASLVICLPIPFQGGVLTVENKKGNAVNFDWGKRVSLSSADSNTIYWACFFCSCDHFISKVTNGYRITIAYDIFTDDSQQNISDKTIQEIYRDECSANLHNFVKNLDMKEIYGYFPNHVYRFSDTTSYSDTNGEQNHLRDKLKGNDLLLYDVFDQLGWKVALEVYYPDIESYGPHVEFQTEYAEEDEDFCMADAIDEDNRKKLSQLLTLKLLNKECNCKTQQIHEYEGVGDEYTGNAPASETKFFYAGTIMVLRHQTKEDNVEKNGSS